MQQQEGEQRPEPEGRDGVSRLADGVPPPTSHARSYHLGSVTVVELSGEIDLGSADLVEPHLSAPAQGPGPALVVLDMGPVDFIDCFGLSLLVRARRRIVSRGGLVRLVCARRSTLRLLALTGLDVHCPPLSNLDDALRDEFHQGA